MASNVNIRFSNWRATGSNVLVPQFRMNFVIEWTDNAGQTRAQSMNVTYPDDLTLVPQEWLREEVEQLLIRAARKRLGIDDDVAPVQQQAAVEWKRKPGAWLLKLFK